MTSGKSVADFSTLRCAMGPAPWVGDVRVKRGGSAVGTLCPDDRRA